MTDTPSLPLRILLATAAALWAVLVPGEAPRVMDQPLQWPRWLRRPQPEILVVRVPAGS